MIGKLDWKLARLCTVLWLACIAAVFALHWPFLFKGFYVEDVLFLGLEFQKSQPGMLAVIDTPADVLDLFRIDRGWYYQPFFLLYMGLAQLLWGNKPLAFHAASLVLHGSVIALAAGLIYRLTRNKTAAFFAASLFLLWPVKHQTVWWISSASTLLALAFALLSIHAWLSFRYTRHVGFYAISLLLSLIALGCKTEGAFALIAIIGIELAGCRTLSRTHWLVAPYAILAGGYILLEKLSVQLVAATGVKPNTFFDRWEAWLEFINMSVGFSGWLLWLLPCYVAYKNSGQKTRKTAVGFIGAASLWAAMLALTIGHLSLAPRFFYLPILCVACGVAVLLTAGRSTAVYLLSLILVYGSIAHLEVFAMFPLPYVAEVLIFVLILPVAYLLNRFRRESEAIYPILVPAAFAVFANGYAVEWLLAVMASFAVACATVALKHSTAESSPTTPKFEAAFPS